MLDEMQVARINKEDSLIIEAILLSITPVPPRLNQEESRSISENVTCVQRKRFADGKVSLPYGQFHQ